VVRKIVQRYKKKVKSYKAEMMQCVIAFPPSHTA